MKEKLEKLNEKLTNTFCKGDYKQNKKLRKKIYKLKEKINKRRIKNMKFRCCICGKEFNGIGNNPYPVVKRGTGKWCCDECNEKYVIPERIREIFDKKGD